MLVLSRRVGERLVIGDNIVITVIDVRSDGVRIGIDAPREVRVNRAEVLEAVKQANVEAAQSPDDDAAVQALRALRPAGSPDTPRPAPPADGSAAPEPAATETTPAVPEAPTPAPAPAPARPAIPRPATPRPDAARPAPDAPRPGPRT